jgi:hypothetical protein
MRDACMVIEIHARKIRTAIINGHIISLPGLTNVIDYPGVGVYNLQYN